MSMPKGENKQYEKAHQVLLQDGILLYAFSGSLGPVPNHFLLYIAVPSPKLSLILREPVDPLGIGLGCNWNKFQWLINLINIFEGSTAFNIIYLYKKSYELRQLFMWN